MRPLGSINCHPPLYLPVRCKELSFSNGSNLKESLTYVCQCIRPNAKVSSTPFRRCICPRGAINLPPPMKLPPEVPSIFLRQRIHSWVAINLPPPMYLPLRCYQPSFADVSSLRWHHPSFFDAYSPEVALNFLRWCICPWGSINLPPPMYPSLYTPTRQLFSSYLIA